MEVIDNVINQKISYEKKYGDVNLNAWSFHTTKDPLTRYLRDRRLEIGIDRMLKELSVTMEDIQDWKVLLVCAGVGGEGIYLANRGFRSVTVSDISENALQVCRRLDSRLKTIPLNAEKVDCDNQSYDLVVVQDGLHHLPRPALGFTEMLRVSRKAVLVIEPHVSLIGKYFGTEWERANGSVNYVYRWDQNMLEQNTKSYLLSNAACIKALQLWDHNYIMHKMVSKLPKAFQLRAAKSIYKVLDFFFSKLGNMMVGVVIKGAPIK